jgi:hypothetical protein
MLLVAEAHACEWQTLERLGMDWRILKFEWLVGDWLIDASGFRDMG